MWFKSKPEKDSYLTKIPFFGYFFRKIKKNRQEIEITLKTGEETKSKIKKKYFLGGIFRIVSGRRFNLLKMPVKAKLKKKRFLGFFKRKKK